MNNCHYTSLFIGLFLAFFIVSIAYLPQFALILFFSLIFNSLLTGRVDAMSNRMPRPLAALAVLLCFIVFMGLAFFIASSTIVPMGQDFINRLPPMMTSFMALPWVKEVPFLSDGLDSVWKQLTTFSTEMMRSSLSVVVSVFTRVIDIVLILLVTYYFLTDGVKIKHWIVSLFAEDQQARIMRLLGDIWQSLRVYISSQLCICLLMGALVYAYFAYRSLPYGPVFAMFSGVCEFIPLVGPTIASCFASLIMVTISPVIGVETIVFFLIVTQINHNIIYPAFVGHSLRLHPLAIILGLALAGELIGPLGMFLAVPTMVTGRLVIEDIHRAYVEREINE